MSDLDSFFAKKDRKKKKKTPATTTTNTTTTTTISSVVQKSKATTTSSTSSMTNNSTSTSTKVDETTSNTSNVATTTPSASAQDGWIELEDPKSAQVNTGGRVVKQFRRDADDASGGNNAGTNNNNTTDDVEDTTEKFSGWSLDKEQEPTPEPEPEPAPQKAVYRPSAMRQAWKPAGPDVKSSAQFPSLADAVKSNAPEVPQSLRAAQVAAKKAAASGLDTPPSSTSRSRPRFINSKAGANGPPRFINSKAAQ